MEETRKTDLAFKLLDNNQNLIKFADSKINVLLIVSGVSTTFVITNFQSLIEIGTYGIVGLIIFFLFFVAFVIASLFTISARKALTTGASAPKTIYFEHIAKRVEVKDFIDDYKKITEDSFLTDILYQVYETSKIACRKFYFYKLSKYLIQAQILMFMLLLALKFLA